MRMHRLLLVDLELEVSVHKSDKLGRDQRLNLLLSLFNCLTLLIYLEYVCGLHFGVLLVKLRGKVLAIETLVYLLEL